MMDEQDAYTAVAKDIFDMMDKLVEYYKTGDMTESLWYDLKYWSCGTISCDEDVHGNYGDQRKKYAAIEIKDSLVVQAVRDADIECDGIYEVFYRLGALGVEQWSDLDEDGHEWFTVRREIK